MMGLSQTKAQPVFGSERDTPWVLSELPADTARRVEAWIDSLGEFADDEWLRIGERCLRCDHELRAIDAACRCVDDVIADRKLGVTAWFVRDLVETATCHLRAGVARRSRRARAQLAIARMAAEWAALAIATEPWLSSADARMLRVLRAPFERANNHRGLTLS